MNEDHLTLGPTPFGEDCAQVGTDNYHDRAMRETRRYIELLEKKFPDKPEGVKFDVRSFPHDFGTYHEVVVVYDRDDEEQVDFALKVEHHLPETWEDTDVVE